MPGRHARYRRLEDVHDLRAGERERPVLEPRDKRVREDMSRILRRQCVQDVRREGLIKAALERGILSELSRW